jgi:hypothetical protein|tara:strand:+ start:104 stop:493 length:390 start_codon:yes stop_codon:yes gene_type:complete
MKWLFYNKMIIPIILILTVNGRVPKSCESKRDASLHYLFREVERVTGGDEITLAMMKRYEKRMPWYGRWTIQNLLPGGVNYILNRCRGDDARITLEGSMKLRDTCVSKCIYASALHKFLNWGYADYWGG